MSERVEEIRQRWEGDPMLGSRDIRDLLAHLDTLTAKLAEAERERDARLAEAQAALAERKEAYEDVVRDLNDSLANIAQVLGLQETMTEHGFVKAPGVPEILAALTRLRDPEATG